MKKYLFIVLLILNASFVFSQELNARVSVNADQISTKYKEKLVNFQREVEAYLNTTKFTSENWEGEKINCAFDIFITSAGNEISYAAQVVVTSNRPIYKSPVSSLMLKLMDKEWKFDYEPNQPFIFDFYNFNGLTSFMDFYALVIIGVDADSFEPFGGNTHFSKAIELAVLGSNSAYSASGWQIRSSSYNRRVFVNEYMETKLQQFRDDFYNYHYNGLDLLNSGEKYKLQGQAQIVKLVENMSKSQLLSVSGNSVLRTFFESKAGEIINSLSDYPDKNIFRLLLKLDPSNTDKYIKVIEEL
jgi:hypothetical protein